MSDDDRVLGAMLGLAVYDGFGAPLEGAPQQLASRDVARGLKMADSGP